MPKEITISDRDEEMLADLRRCNLRHPGLVDPRIVKLYKRTNFTRNHLADLRLEWLKLGLNKEVSPK